MQVEVAQRVVERGALARVDEDAHVGDVERNRVELERLVPDGVLGERVQCGDLLVVDELGAGHQHVLVEQHHAVVVEVFEGVFALAQWCRFVAGVVGG